MGSAKTLSDVRELARAGLTGVHTPEHALSMIYTLTLEQQALDRKKRAYKKKKGDVS